MVSQYSPSIDEELIAAYVDGDLTAEERQRVEAAMAVNDQIAWEVNTLRQTIELLHDMPRVALPRSFVLTEDQVGDVLEARRGRARAASAIEVEAPVESPWQRLLDYLYGGNPVFRNAAAVAAVLLLLVVVAEIPLQQSQISSRAPESGQTPGASLTPRVQVTVVGGSFPETADGEDVIPLPEEQVADGSKSVTVTEASSDQESGDTSTDIGVTSTDDGDAETVVSTPQPTVATPEKLVDSGASERSQSSQATAVSTPPVPSDSQSEVDSRSSLLTLFRYARLALVVAAIALWLLSRYKRRESRA